MVIKGFEKTTLVDYPSHIATTVFTVGCNMRCPFCHNRELVIGNRLDSISLDTFFDFLKKRHTILEAVCITGGEPTLHDDLIEFLQQIKSYGLKTKLDTNGLKPEMIKLALDEKLLDFIAMDIKNSLQKYSVSTGITESWLPKISQSVEVIKQSNINYEFRTTVMRELHTLEDFISIGHWLNGSKNYTLQQYYASENQLTENIYTSYSVEEMEHIKHILLPFFDVVNMR